MPEIGEVNSLGAAVAERQMRELEEKLSREQKRRRGLLRIVDEKLRVGEQEIELGEEGVENLQRLMREDKPNAVDVFLEGCEQVQQLEARDLGEDQDKVTELRERLVAGFARSLGAEMTEEQREELEEALADQTDTKGVVVGFARTALPMVGVSLLGSPVGLIDAIIGEMSQAGGGR